MTGDGWQRRMTGFDTAEPDARAAVHCVDARAQLIVTFVYLASMLSLSPTDVADLVLFALYPIVAAAMTDIRFSRLLYRSLVALPFAVAVGAFNPMIDREPMFAVAGAVISRGWITFASIALRGMLSVQAVLLIVDRYGFFELCRALGRLGLPALFTSGLMFVYRYVFVVAADGAALKRAVDARRASRGALPLRVWGAVVGRLMVRSLERAERVGAAMQARGFDGRFRSLHRKCWTSRDTLYTVTLAVLFIAVRTLRPARLFDLL